MNRTIAGSLLFAASFGLWAVLMSERVASIYLNLPLLTLPGDMLMPVLWSLISLAGLTGLLLIAAGSARRGRV
jgi:hypothetical protein